MVENSTGIAVAHTAVQSARQAALVGLTFAALTRFPTHPKLVTAVGLTAIGAVGLLRGAAPSSQNKDDLCMKGSTGTIYGLGDLATHTLDLLCVYQLAKLVKMRPAASILRHAMVIGGTSLWGAYRLFGAYVNNFCGVDNGYGEDVPAIIAPFFAIQS